MTEEKAPERELDADQTARALSGYIAVKQAAKAQGLGKGHPGQGTVVCQCGGIIAFSVAGSNGHVWARCSTEGCVRFIE